MKYLDPRKRLGAADKLLRGDTTSREKFESIRKLVKGINPKLDKNLKAVSKALSQVEKVRKKQVIKLTVEALPEKTEKQKKRKKALLLLIKYWKQLKSEVKRVTKELEKHQGKQTSVADKVSSGSKIIAYAKGPLGIVTAAATLVAAAAVTLKSIAVTITIINQGCQTLNPAISVPISIPGLKLPNQPIPAGSSATAILPPLKFSIDDSRQSLRLRVLGADLSFTHSANVDILFNGSSLLGKRVKINLGSQKQHTVVVKCR